MDNSNLPNGTTVSVEGYVGTGTIIERIEGGYVVRGMIPGDTPDGYLVNEAPVSQFMVTPVDDEHPALGTTYLDRATGMVYRIRGYSHYTDGPNIAAQHPSGGMSSVRNADTAAILGHEVIWTSRFLTRD
jgi:hypothetical protein